MRVAVILSAVVVGACASPGSLQTPSPSPSASSATTPHAGPTVVPPAIANLGLADLVRSTGRSELRICLHVDPATGSDKVQMLALLSATVDTLRSKGYSVISATPAECPQAPLYLRTNTVHPKNSGQGPVGSVPRVTTPDVFLLHVAVTTGSQLTRIFGGLSTRRGTEEITCTGDNCGEITSAIYGDVAEFQDAGRREVLVVTGLGLLAQ